MRSSRQSTDVNLGAAPTVLPPRDRLPVISRQQAVEALEAILHLAAPERVLNVIGPQGGEGKTWCLLGLQQHCRERGLLYNEHLIDFYDTAHQRVSGVLFSIIHALDPGGSFFIPYLEKRDEFDRRRAAGYGGPALAPLSQEMDRAFLDCLQAFGRARRRNGQRGVVLFFDTWEAVSKGRLGHWLLDEFLEATADIAVVIAGRPAIPAEQAQAPIRSYQPERFSLDEIQDYIEKLLEHHGILDQQQVVQSLAKQVFWNSAGLPVLVALVMDIITLHILPLENAQTLDVNLVLDALRGRQRETIEQDLVETLVELLGGTPEQQWAVLYMAHLRRRFNKQIFSFLQDRPAGGTRLLESFKQLYVVKYRELGSAYRLPPEGPLEISTLLHDRIREDVRRRYWQGAIPTPMVMRAREAGLFPPDLDALWAPYCAEQADWPTIPAPALKPILNWLDKRIITYYEGQRATLKQRLAQAKDDHTRQTELSYRQHDLMAEQLLYELDRDQEAGWQHWRQEYYEAFESYQQGYCEQLELTVLGAWNNGELEADPRKRDIQEMVQVRRWWWFIQHSAERRQKAIQALEDLLSERKPLPGGQPSELLADVHAALGWAYWLEGDTPRSLQHREQAAAAFRQLGLARSRGGVLDFLGESYDSLGRFAEADAVWDEAIQIAREHRIWYLLASVAMKWGDSLNLRGESGRALGYARLAESLFRQIGDKRGLGLALNRLGRIYQGQGKFHHAKRALTEAHKLVELFGGSADRVRLGLSWGEFHRRRAQAPEYAQPDDFGQARKILEDTLKLAQDENFRNWETWAEGELGTLFRDLAVDRAAAGQVEEARVLWGQAEEKLRKALQVRQEENAHFWIADLLDDLCELYEAQRRFGVNGREALESCLTQLETVARAHNLPRFLSRATEWRARLAWEDGRYKDAVQQYVDACVYAGQRTPAGETFRSAYNRLVGELERHLAERPDEEKVELTRLALHLWGSTGQASRHPQFVQACHRILHPAQLRLRLKADEKKADDLFERGRQAFVAGQREQGEKDFSAAFIRYVNICEQLGQRIAESYEYYKWYMAVVEMLERRFYDLPDLALASQYSQDVEAEWRDRGYADQHPAVIESCQRVQDMARLARIPTDDRIAPGA